MMSQVRVCGKGGVEDNYLVLLTLAPSTGPKTMRKVGGRF